MEIRGLESRFIAIEAMVDYSLPAVALSLGLPVDRGRICDLSSRCCPPP